MRNEYVEISAELQTKGWHLSQEGLDICCKDIERLSVPAVIQKALNSDLRDIGSSFLPEDANKIKADFVTINGVVQIQKVKNASAPKYEYGSGAPPLLRLLITDGTTYSNVLQWSPWKNISVETPPGSKILLKGNHIPLQNGFLLLSESQFTFLGGHVEPLVQKWEIQKQLASHVRERAAGTGPPPWTPFGKPITSQTGSHFKALHQQPEGGEKEEDLAFKQQRQANIAQVLNVKAKVFGGGATAAVSKVGNGQTESSNDRSFGNKGQRQPHFNNSFEQANKEDNQGNRIRDDRQSYRDETQGNRGGYQGNRDGFQGNRGGYQGNRDEYQGNRGGHQRNRDGNQGNRDGYQGNREGYQANRDVYQGNRDGYQGNRDGFQGNRGGYQENRGGFQGNRDGYQGNRGGYQGNRDGYQDNRDGFQGNNRDGNQGNRDGYQGNNRDGNQGNRDGFQGNNRDSYQGRREDNFSNRGQRGNRSGYQENRDGFQGNAERQQDNRDGYQTNSEGNQDNRSYSRNRESFQDNRNYNQGTRDSFPGNRRGNRGGHQEQSRGTDDRNYNRGDRLHETSDPIQQVSNRMQQVSLHGYSSSQSAEVTIPSKPFLKPGAFVMAKYWEDNQHYQATVHALGPEGRTCVVFFPEYGNHEEVLVDDVKEMRVLPQADNREWNAGPITFRMSDPRGDRSSREDYGGDRNSRNNTQRHSRNENYGNDRNSRQDFRPSTRLYQPPRQRHP